MASNDDKAEKIAGIAVFFGLLTGAAALTAAMFSFFNYNWTSAGICLGAAALAFGLIANAVLRH